MASQRRSNNLNLKFIPTSRLVEILSSPLCIGIDGRDYGPVKEELEAILWERQERESVEMQKLMLRSFLDDLNSDETPPTLPIEAA